jgi:hypothetical protein
MMKHSVAALPLLFLLAACPADGRKEDAAPAKDKSVLEYAAPFRQIILSADLRLSDIEELPEYDNPVSAVPSKMTKTEKTAQVAAAEADELLQFIRESGFDGLKDAYGAKPEERSYPHRILVRDGATSKEVICRSSPAAEACPEVFVKVEKRIIKFVHKAVEPKTGE